VTTDRRALAQALLAAQVAYQRARDGAGDIEEIERTRAELARLEALAEALLVGTQPPAKA
jgi:hypothetical protein